MGFLSEYDQINLPDPAQRAAAQSALLVSWLRNRQRELLDELRENRPVFVNPVFVIVSRATDVIDVLSKHETYTVRLNSLTMDPSVGPFMLARDETPLNWHEKSVMKTVLRHDDLARIRALVGSVVAAEIAAAAGKLDVVPRVGRLVPLRIVQDYFGFKAPDADLLRWSFATQHAMFRNLGGDKTVVAACIAAGEEMRHWLWPFVTERIGYPSMTGDDATGRLIRLAANPDLDMPPERIVSNVCGLLVGSIETTSQAIVQALAVLLNIPNVLAEAIEAAKDPDPTRFDGYVFEALRFQPITGLQLRFIAKDGVIGTGTPYATPVKAGQRLAAATGAAMFDADLFPDPTAFKPDRPRAAYFHMGFGHHECLGKYVGLTAIPEAIRQLLLVPGLQRAAGAAGQVDFAGGPFPAHFHVTWPATKVG